MSKIIHPDNEKKRLEELNSYFILNSDFESDFDNITHLIANICKVPIATITLIDENREWFKSCIGLNIRENDRKISFCARAIISTKPLIIEDASQHPDYYNNPMVTGAPHIRFYAGVPLISPKGFALGTLAIKDFKPRKLTYVQVESLISLSVQVMVLLEKHRQTNYLQTLNKELEFKTKELDKKSEFLSALLESLSEGIVACDETGRLSLFNHATRELHGVHESPLPPEEWPLNFVCFRCEMYITHKQH